MDRILIVEDDMNIAQQIELILSQSGYKTLHATDGNSAVSMAEMWAPDLVLLDLMLPGLNGFDVLKQLRQSQVTVTTPVIILSSRTDIQDKAQGFRAGADDYVIKPFIPSELVMRVEAHLRRLSESAAPPPTYRVDVPSRFPLVVRQGSSGMFRRSYRLTKRLFDLIVSLLALPFALPLMLLIALLVRLDSPGPIIFKQQRTGVDGKRFTMLKFRTMFENAEELKLKYAHLNQLTWPDFKIADDPRVTRVGKILRKTSLDEIPQLFNVIIGDMSLVGPRPTSFAANTYELWQTERLEVRPGLTGLWQVNGRSDTDFEERCELDIEYIERQSWALDLHILASTFTAVLTGRGSY